jgi:hypothetical protein
VPFLFSNSISPYTMVTKANLDRVVHDMQNKFDQHQADTKRSLAAMEEQARLDHRVSSDDN